MQAHCENCTTVTECAKVTGVMVQVTIEGCGGMRERKGHPSLSHPLYCQLGHHLCIFHIFNKCSAIFIERLQLSSSN